MAKETVTAGKVLVNSVDLSEYVASVTMDDTAEKIETTNLATAGYRSYMKGLKDAAITLNLHNDHAAGKVADTLQPLYDAAAGTLFPVKVWPKSAGTIVYTLEKAELFSKPMFGGAAGELSALDVEFANGGTTGITRGTA